MRPDFYHGDYSCHRDDYSFFTGEDLFVSPVIRPGEKKHVLSLPEGEWAHLLTGRTYPGGELTVEAPLGLPAVFYRTGSGFAGLFRAAADEYMKGRS